jgi:hypothetical protein
VIIRVMYGRRDVVGGEPGFGYAFRCAYYDVQIGDVVLVPSPIGAEEATVCRLDCGTRDGDVKDIIAMLEKRAFVKEPTSIWWTLPR